MSSLSLKDWFELWKATNFINGSKQRKRRMALSCSKKELFTLLRGVTWKHHGEFYCLNCLHSFRTENKLKSHEKISKNKDFCGIVMPSEKDNILKFNQYMNLIKCHILFMLTLNL